MWTKVHLIMLIFHVMSGDSAILPELCFESSCISRCRKGSTRPGSYRAWHALPRCKLMLLGVDKSRAPPRWYASTIGCAQNLFKWFWNGGSKLCRRLVFTRLGAESATRSIQSDEAKCRQSVGYPHQVPIEASPQRLEEVVGLRARLTHEMLAAVQDSEDSNEKLQPLQESHPEGERCESGSPAGCSSRGMSTQNICSMWVYSWLL